MSIYIYDSTNISIFQGQNTNNNLDDYVNETFGNRKKGNEVIQKAYFRLELAKQLPEGKAKRLLDCWSHIKIAKHRITNEIKLVSANSCRVRLCPACAWRRMRKFALENALMLTDFAVKTNYKYIFLTVTVKNCTGTDLPKVLNNMLGAWYKMLKLRRLKSINIGCIRNLEITYNRRSKTFHPHIHAIIAVPPTYIGKDYITQAEWAEYWKKAMDLDYTPVTDVRAIKNILSDKSCWEISKYVAKISTYINLSPSELDSVIQNMDIALTNRRIISYTGAFRKWRREKKLEDDIKDGDSTALGDEWEVFAYQYIYGRQIYVRTNDAPLPQCN